MQASGVAPDATVTPGSIDYEHFVGEALAGVATAGATGGADVPGVDPSPDDLVLVLTGGTTGSPKAVLWRQADLAVAALGARNFANKGSEFDTLDELVESSLSRPAACLSAG